MSRIVGFHAIHDEGLAPKRGEKLDRQLASAMNEPWAGPALDRFLIGIRDQYKEVKIWLLIESDGARELWALAGGKMEVFDPADPAHAEILSTLLKPRA